MYLTRVKAMMVLALQQAFDDGFPDPRFRRLNVDIEYPVDQQSYPGIWVDYDDTDVLKRAGVNHQEVALVDVPTGLSGKYSRWRFQGSYSLTVVALTSLERDDLFDALVAMVAFGAEDPDLNQFRTYVENNDLIAANLNFDTIQVRGNAAAPGTPWNTDEIIYEKSIGLDVIGEFVLNRVTGDMVPLSEITVTGRIDQSITAEDMADEGGTPPDGGWI